jgi:DNA-binding NarL/FixJ family response regulator
MTGVSEIGVMVVDDHPMWRQTLAQVIEAAEVGRVVAETSRGEDAVRLAREASADVVVMDLNLPGLDGAAATRELLDALPDVRVLVLSASDDRADMLEAIRSGANGYLLKTAQPAEVVDAIRRVHRGELVVPPEIAETVKLQLRGQTRRRDDPLDTLTRRERQVLTLMAEGRSNQAICEQLVVSTRAVEGHVRNIFIKLGLEPTPDDHRRVLAVLAYLRSTSE